MEDLRRWEGDDTIVPHLPPYPTATRQSPCGHGNMQAESSQNRDPRAARRHTVRFVVVDFGIAIQRAAAPACAVFTLTQLQLQ
jgi:hypothetical protein